MEDCMFWLSYCNNCTFIINLHYIYLQTVLGSFCVGKSALTIGFVSDNFFDEYDPIIQDNYTKSANIDAVPSVLDILDTAGQQRFSLTLDLEKLLKQQHGFIIVYSIDADDTFGDFQSIFWASAKHNINVVECFYEIVRICMKKWIILI